MTSILQLIKKLNDVVSSPWNSEAAADKMATTDHVNKKLVSVIGGFFFMGDSAVGVGLRV